jgi:hypothetical protein
MPYMEQFSHFGDITMVQPHTRPQPFTIPVPVADRHIPTIGSRPVTTFPGWGPRV